MDGMFAVVIHSPVSLEENLFKTKRLFSIVTPRRIHVHPHGQRMKLFYEFVCNIFKNEINTGPYNYPLFVMNV